jgi:NAD(P)-dependent dehydrogenase (short-subunit alcohol dehydrogenase family)
MKIYFACSITGGREFESAYQAIARGLAENGHNVLTAHLVESDAMATEAALTPEDVYSRDIAWIRECDVLIAEVSTFARRGIRARFCTWDWKTRAGSMSEGSKSYEDDQWKPR